MNICSAWRAADHWGAIQMRLGISRDRYEIAPGLYALHSPSVESPVLVTANYKLTFDLLRRELDGISAWILVLDTKGINVWCAAGKGTFSAQELVRQIQATRLNEVVTTKTLLLPQLAAPGVCAHEVTKATGYRVVYGPVRARDIKAFLQAGQVKTPDMARVTFDLADRMRVVPVEIFAGFKYVLGMVLIYVLLRWALWRHLSVKPLVESAPVFGAFFVGTMLFPALLPWNVFRSFSAGGAFLGAILAAISVVILKPPLFGALALFLLLPAISGFTALNFTGSTTFTSLAGVRKEMRIAMPALMTAAGIGVLSIIAGVVTHFIRG